ncbi:Nose resistant-to-fluoxetine protein N-terminal domain-containing protein [Caenorhabditis elegans]|uniref:Nose resistant-to-fluoxetine protein N-terminal domain-containing protein n=1 Tax=Caenorhabditis elegans TaxID=6239 RepID=G5EBI1_CAEEL|nr:Nose resistant-to-fluoxetine protein N-terminal domain-containing protein [Caenorhabditis elegans]CAB05693.2 Nose resistant-to-fluoxetine protein N-terminal domain-containing protein [Caenorhabditis elegans]|eukprot:NP_507114.2 O-ACyltransferase homolog [Caenorhabditis elegans]
MNDIFRIIFCVTLLAVVLGKDWKNDFLRHAAQQSITGVSEQCAKETEMWQMSLKTVAQVSEQCLIEKKCSSEELKIIDDNFYAIEQYDAWGKIPLTGLFQDPLLLDGSYQECERISGKKYETNYCYMVLIPGKNATCHMSNGQPTSMFFREAVCMPYSCSEKDLPTVFNQISKQPLTACIAYCSSYPVEKTPAFWGFTSFMAVMIGIALLATVIDYLKDALKQEDQKRSDSRILQILLTFSLWTNAELLLSVKEQKPGFIKCLDCIRFLSMLWIVTGHTFSYLMMPDQIQSVLPFPGRFWNHLILSAFYSVDTFFLLSGLVVSYLFFKTKLKVSQIKSPVTWILFYVHRYLRLTPPMIFFIGFLVVYGYYIQGPGVASQLNQLNPQVDVCVVNWWQNLLYINNLIPDANQCYGITWYLGADTQLYLVAPVFLVGLYFSFAIGTALLTAATVGSVIAVYILYSYYDLPADFFGNGDNTHFYDMIYDKPWIRGTPYFIGIFFGYLLATYGKRKVRLNWALAVTGWLVAFSLAAICIFSTYDYDNKVNWSIFSRATYFNFSRLAWSFALSWVIVANHMGWGGPIDAFMSHPIWQPFGRLSYCAYIVHYVVLYMYLMIGVGPLHFYSSFQLFMYYAVPTTLLSYIFAFFWSCLFEVPFLKLEKMLIETMISRVGSGKVEDIEKTIIDRKKNELWVVDEKEEKGFTAQNVDKKF